MKESEAQPRFGIGTLAWTAFTLTLLGLGLAVLTLSLLRETPEFWTAAGGFSPAAKEFVRITFFPLAALYALLITIDTIACLKSAHPFVIRKRRVVCVTPLWALLWLIALIVSF